MCSSKSAQAERKLQQEVKAKLDAVEMQLHHTRAHLEEAEQRKREAEMEANEVIISDDTVRNLVSNSDCV
jgi:uncharacterized protein (DUF3084 family)